MMIFYNHSILFQNHLYKRHGHAYNVAGMDINRILFFKPGAIGDFLHTLPSISALKRKYPEAKMTVVVSPGQEKLIEGTIICDDTLVYRKDVFKKSIRDFLQFGLKLRRGRYDLFVDMQPSLRSAILRMLSGAQRVLVYRKQKRIRTGEKRLHAVENFIQTLAPLGINDKVDRISLPIRPDAVVSVRQRLHRGLEHDDIPLIALNCSVGAARPARNWIPERFAELAERIWHVLGAGVVFVGGKEDRALVEGVISEIRTKAISLAGELDLAETAALLSLCRCLVSSDTGPLHLATAVGTPVVGLYGSTDPKRTGPVGHGHRVLIKNLPCVPCEKKNCPLGTRECMSAITVDEVLDSVKKVMR